MILNSTTTCENGVSTTICTTTYAADPSSTIAAANGFTYGEIVNSFFLFLILMTGLVIAFHLMFRKTKIRN